MLATVGLANVYGPKGIRINAINPGSTMTDRVREALNLEAKKRGFIRRRGACPTAGKSPAQTLRPLPKTSRTSRYFLASNKASYITGAIVPMDGGLNPVL